MKAAAERDLSVGGAGAGRPRDPRRALVDECCLFLSPIVVGGGTPALPDGLRWPLELVDERRFGNGVVYLRYRASTPAG